MKKYALLFGILALVGAGCVGSGSAPTSMDPSDVIDRNAILTEAKQNGLIMNDEEVIAMVSAVSEDSGTLIVSDVERLADANVRDWQAAALADVTGGESFGLAHAIFENGVYTVIAQMGGLPELSEDYHYEGWIVRRGDQLSAISTGPVVYGEKAVFSGYRSSTDLSDYAFFVLTLEPNDGNPSPAEHILEGTLK